MGKAPCLSEYRLDKHALGLETPEELEETQRHLSTCELCRLDVEQVRQGLHSPSHVAIPTLPWWQEWLHGMQRAWLLTTLAGATAALAVFFYVANPFPSKTSQRWLAKGAPVLMVALQRKGKVRPARSGEMFYLGDKIRLAYRWDYPGYVFFLHRDRRSQATPLYPSEATRPSIQTQQGGNQLLPGSLEVEGKPDGFEEIWACFSTQPLSWQAVTRSLPTQTSLQLRWEPGPRKQCNYLIRFLLRRP
ncbi:MAG: hypothetical protein EP343_06015 [Deltaproteobacteria bacterium]|nr:MAG: hypothetical protein EP343_06015 [Deltaproteobacteria bacterium]